MALRGMVGDGWRMRLEGSTTFGLTAAVVVGALTLPGAASAQQKPAAPASRPVQMAQARPAVPPAGAAAAPAAAATGKPGNPTTLQDALALAYSTNPTLLAERAKLRSVDENVPTALAGWRPTIVISVAPGYAFGTYTSSAGQSVAVQNNRDTLAAQATVTQYLYRGGKTRAQTAQAMNQVMAERGRLINSEQTVFSTVINAYVTVIEDQQLLQLDINNEQVLKRQLDATNDRFRVGEITRTDVAQAEAALAGASAQREVAYGNLQIARSAYFQAVSAQPDNLVEPQPLATGVKSSREASILASTNNPAVVAAMFDDATAKDAIDVAFAALMPTVSLQAAGLQSNNSTVIHQQSSGGSITANITVPLYQGGSEYAAVRQARQTEQNARQTLDGARSTAVQQSTQAYETLIASRATIVSTRTQIRSNEIALEGVEREAIVGSRTTLDVLNAQQTLLSSQVTLVQNLAALVNASYTLAQAIGRLTAHDLKLPVAYYDETAYFQAVKDRWAGTGDYATDQPGR